LRPPRACESKVKNGKRTEVELYDLWFVRAVRQFIQDLFNLLVDVNPRLVLVDAELELDEHQRQALLVDRVHAFDAGDGGNGVLDTFGDLTFHFLGTCPGINRGHRDKRKLDVGKQIDNEPQIREETENENRRDDDGGQHRSGDGHF
jgi:hypothetical protein